MSHNILLTGAPGYIGGTILARWKSVALPGYCKLFCLVRSDEQAKTVQSNYNAVPLQLDLNDIKKTRQAIIDCQITIILYLIDAYTSDIQTNMMEALAEVKKDVGVEVHFVQTSGAKMFSSSSDFPTDRLISDADPDMYKMHKAQSPTDDAMRKAVRTNCAIIDEGDRLGVRTYIAAPCIVYGKGEGFGNKITIQLVDIVSAAMKAGRVFKFRDDRPEWPVCSLSDTAEFFLMLIKSMLENSEPGHGQHGFYLAASGSVVWDDLYAAIAKALHKRGIIHDDTVTLADNDALDKIAAELEVSKSAVEVKVSGRSTWIPEHGKALGWNAKFPPTHIFEAVDSEVENILENMHMKKKGHY